MKLFLVDINPDMISAWKNAFKDYPDVEIILGDIISFAENTIVSPANSFGLIDGGIDLLYRQYFGDILQRNILKEISKQYSNGLLPVGSAVIVETGSKRIPYLISAPTMEVPEPVNPMNAFFAMNAILKIAEKHKNIVTKIYCPGLCTGTGLVNEDDAANEMANAYHKYLNRNRIDKN